MRDHVWLGQAREHALKGVSLAAELQPDAILVSLPLMGAMAGAEASLIPAAGIGTTLMGGIRFERPDHPGRAFWEMGLDQLNRSRDDIGLQPLRSSIFEQYDALDRVLVLSVPELHDPAVRLDANVRYTGPPIAAGPLSAAPEDSLVLISFSTGNMAQGPVLQRVLDALETSGIRGVLTLGPAVARASLRIPQNVEAHDQLPHADVLPRVSAVVTHAGHGTVMAALAHGVPLLCLPMGRDQPYVAERVAAVGAGIFIAPDVTPAAIAEALARLLAEPSFRRNAEKIRASIEVLGGTAVAELEDLSRSSARPTAS